MWRYDLLLKSRLYRLLKWRIYRNYAKRIHTMTNQDPFALSCKYLDQLLSFVSEHNTYYAEFLTGRRVLKNLPILTKEIIRERFDDLQSTKQTTRTYRNSSGGSTGKPVILVQDNSYSSWSNATRGYYFREFLGVEMFGARSVWLWGSERDTFKLNSRRVKVGLFLQNRLLLNTFDTSEQRWLEYIENIRSYRPHYVAGYAGSLYQIARVARKNNIRLYKPDFVYSAAEMLRDFMRREIEEQFNTKVYDYYGSREVGAIAGECSAGRRHVFIMNNLVEILDDESRPMVNGKEGRITVTNLHNYSFPMIRYDIGDSGAIRFDECPCGSSLPVLEKLTGRVTDHFLLRDGGLVHGEYFTHLFYFRDWVEQFQVDQVDYNRVRILVVADTPVNDHDVDDINAKIRLVMGRDCSLEWQYVDSIEKTPQGKYLFTRCLIDEATR